MRFVRCWRCWLALVAAGVLLAVVVRAPSWDGVVMASFGSVFLWSLFHQRTVTVEHVERVRHPDTWVCGDGGRYCNACKARIGAAPADGSPTGDANG